MGSAQQPGNEAVHIGSEPHSAGRSHAPPLPSAGIAHPPPSTSGNRGRSTEGGRNINPQTLSSDTSAVPRRRSSSHSTGVRRKSSSSIKLVADATLEGNEKLVAGLKDINETAKELKHEELALEMKIHEENLRYNKEKDMMLLENSKLALMNQAAVVAVMTSLADAIRSDRAPPVVTRTTAGDHATAATTPIPSIAEGSIDVENRTCT
jgi:hypothetical protein